MENSKNDQSDFDLWFLPRGFGSWSHFSFWLDERLHPKHDLLFLLFMSPTRT